MASSKTYPIYIQKDAIESLANQLSETRVVSTTTVSNQAHESSTTVGGGIKGSILSLLGISAKLEAEDSKRERVGSEAKHEYAPEQRARQVVGLLLEDSALDDLNACLREGRGPGQYVTFLSTARFARKFETIELVGTVEGYRLKAICSSKYFPSHSLMLQLIGGSHDVVVAGFGVVLSIGSEKRIDLKPLVLGLAPVQHRLA